MFLRKRAFNPFVRPEQVAPSTAQIAGATSAGDDAGTCGLDQHQWLSTNIYIIYSTKEKTAT